MTPVTIAFASLLAGAATLVCAVLFAKFISWLLPFNEVEADDSIDDWTPEGDQLNPVRDVNVEARR